MADGGPPDLLLAWRRPMRFLTDVLRSRVLPAIVAALGVSFIAAGLLTYTTGTDADVFPFAGGGTALASPSDGPAPSDVVLPSASPGATIAPSAIPSASGTIDVLPSPLTTDEPSAAPSESTSPASSDAPSADPSAGGSAVPSVGTATARPKPSPTVFPSAQPGGHVATRVVIPALDIDLPVVRPPGGATTYPLCNVAMYIQNLSQPGYDGATYLYAHARVGMFLPLLDQSKINNGRGMLGMLVQVYTSDNQYFLYQITEVRRHQLTLADAVAAKTQQLWLQTSEGPRGTPGKLQVIAMPISSGPADPKDANPTPHPVVCG